MKSIGRNDPCPCGSGKKYKRCCLQKDIPTVSTELPWKQVRTARDSLNAQMMDFSTQVYGRETLQRAWTEWCCDHEEQLVMQGSEFVMFMSWFLVDWVDHDEREIPLPPLSWKFRSAFKDRLSPIERAYLDSVMDESFSFFEILKPKPGDGYFLRDLLTGREVYVSERSGSQGVMAGAFLYGRLAAVGNITIFDAVSEILFPMQWKNTVLELRQNLRRTLRIPKDKMPTKEHLTSFSAAIRGLYRNFRHEAQNPRTPELVNTDGEKLSFNKVVFEIENADTLFESLHSLCLSDTREQLFDDAQKDSTGKIIKAEFPWLKRGNKQQKGMENTVLGHVTIESNRLTVNTNSLERVGKIKDLVKKRCGTLARYKATLIEPLEAKMAEHGSYASQNASTDDKQRELMNIPEVKSKLQEMQRKHMESWVTQKIPALGNKTPVMAMKSPEGMEMVESLLRQFEQGAGVMGDRDFELELIRGIREKLGLLTRRYVNANPDDFSGRYLGI